MINNRGKMMLKIRFNLGFKKIDKKIIIAGIDIKIALLNRNVSLIFIPIISPLMMASTVPV
jgi:hypothetical protein